MVKFVIGLMPEQSYGSSKLKICGRKSLGEVEKKEGGFRYPKIKLKM